MKFTVFSLVSLSNIEVDKLFTKLPICTSSKDLQSENFDFPSLVFEFGIINFFKDVLSLIGQSDISVTLYVPVLTVILVGKVASDLVPTYSPT